MMFIFLFSLSILPSILSWESDHWKERGGFYGSPSNATDESKQVCDYWHEHDLKLHKFIADTIPADLAHNGAAPFDHHLKGLQAVLRAWNSPEYLTDTALFHSIYGTEGFQGFQGLSMLRRPDIRNLIGEKAERLVWLFCCMDRRTFDATLDMDDANAANRLKLTAREELGRFPLTIPDQEEWLDLVELTLADFLEQVEGAASKVNPDFGWDIGGAYSYRRVAYGKMAEILSVKRAPRLQYEAKRMHDAIYATEGVETRMNHQPITPPITAAAKAAKEAIMSINM